MKLLDLKDGIVNGRQATILSTAEGQLAAGQFDPNSSAAKLAKRLYEGKGTPGAKAKMQQVRDARGRPKQESEDVQQEDGDR